jgi:Putative DNA-binding domain
MKTAMRILREPIESITAQDVQQLCADQVSEGSEIELKADLPSKDGLGKDSWHTGKSVGQYARNEIAEEIIAFANTFGGVVCIGINETKDHPKRAANPNPLPRVHDLARQLRQAVYDIIDPPLPILESWGIDLGSGCGVVLLRVSPSRRRPHRHQANKEVFIRRSDESVRLSMREIQELTIHAVSEAAKIDTTIAERRGEHRKDVLQFLESTRSPQERIWGGGLQFFAMPTSSFDLGRVVGRPELTNLSSTVIADFSAAKYPCAWPHATTLEWRPGLRRISAEKRVSERKTDYSLLTSGACEISFSFKATDDRPGLFAGWLVGGLGAMLGWIERIRAEGRSTVEFALAPQLSIFGKSISLCRYGSSSFAEGHATTLPPGFHEFPIMSVGPVEEFPKLLLRFDEDFWNLGGYDTQRTAPSFTFGN